MKLKLKKVEPKEIIKSFTRENEENKENNMLGFYFYIQDGQLNLMNSCEKFVSAYGKKLQMLKLVLSGQHVNEEDLVEFELAEVNSFFVANRILLNHNKEIFFYKAPWEILRPVSDYYEFIENIEENSKFFVIKK